MTKKEYWVTKHNVSHLKQKTWLLGLFYFFSSANCFLSYFHQLSINPDNAHPLLQMGLALLVVTPIVVRDKKKANRDLISVIVGFAVFIFLTIILAITTSFGGLLVIGVIESIFCIIVLLVLCKEIIGRQINAQSKSKE